MTVSKLTRLKCVDMFTELLPEYTPEQITYIEMSLYEKNPLNETEYINNSKRICHNIAFMHKDHVDSFINKSDTVIARISDAKMRGPLLQSVMENERAEYDNTLKMLYEKVEEGSVASLKQKAAITCKKCDSSEIVMAMAQTRSADEGATMFFTCVKCNQKWKVQ